MNLFLRLFSVICLLSSASVASATEPTDLGQGLGYLRIKSLAASASDLSAALLHPAPLVLDLRYTADEPGAADVLRVLSSQSEKPMLYVLVSPATPAAVAGIIATATTPLVTLGIKDSHPVAQVVVEQTPAADHAAYDALATGTSLAQLTSGRVEKERFDEAALVQEFKRGNHEARPPESPKANTPAAASPAIPPVDRVLQRAIHLHRARLALHR
jgi:hypothetical protein